MLKISSGCSLWVKEVDDMPTENIDVCYKIGIIKLSELRNQTLPIPNGNLVTQECKPRREGLNSESHTLGVTDHWCRQEKILLTFPGDDPRDAVATSRNNLRDEVSWNLNGRFQKGRLLFLI